MPVAPRDPILREYLATRRAKWSAANVDGAAATLERLRRHLESTGVDLLGANPADLQEWINTRLDAGLSPNTVIVDHRQAKAFYRWAAGGDDPLIERNPMTRVDAPKANEPDPARMPVLAEADYRALLATCRAKGKPAGKGTKTCNDERDAAMLALLWSTGMRRNELVAIEYRDIDWDAMTIHLRKTKGRGKTRSRVVPFDDDALHYLNRFLRRRGNAEGPLFTTTQTRAMQPNTVTLMLRRRAAQAGVDPTAAGCAHAFRRALANDWQAQGGEIANLETVMGWKHDGRMAAHYARKTESARAIAEARRLAEARSAGRHLRAVGE